MIGTTFVDSLATQCRIGCDEIERAALQPILIDIQCKVEMQQAVASDHRRDCVDYCELQQIALDVASRTSYALLETLAHHIALEILKLSHVLRVTIAIRKPHKLPGSLAVGISITLNQEAAHAEHGSDS